MNSSSPFLHRTGLSAVFLCLGVGLLTAGPLDPPAGPVTATGPTGIYSLPYAISASGSYELRNDVTLAEGGTGITITADHVSLDLGGYVVANSSGNSSTAIALSGNRSGIIVRGGLLSGWTNLLSESAGDADTHVLLEDLRFSGSAGILAPGGRGFTVRRVALMVGGAGIWVGDWARVEGCDVLALSTTRTGDGIVVGSNSAVSGSRVESGRNGIYGGDYSTVVDSIVQGFGNWGIRLTFSGRVYRSTASANGSPETSTAKIGIQANNVSFSYSRAPRHGIWGTNVSFSTGMGTDDTGIDRISSSEPGIVTSSLGMGGEHGITAELVMNSIGKSGNETGAESISAKVGVGSFGLENYGIGGMDIDYPYNVPTLPAP